MRIPIPKQVFLDLAPAHQKWLKLPSDQLACVTLDSVAHMTPVRVEYAIELEMQEKLPPDEKLMEPEYAALVLSLIEGKA